MLQNPVKISFGNFVITVQLSAFFERVMFVVDLTYGFSIRPQNKCTHLLSSAHINTPFEREHAMQIILLGDIPLIHGLHIHSFNFRSL